jgi:hypothetical protein
LDQAASIGCSVTAAHREPVAELLKLVGDDSPLVGPNRDEAWHPGRGPCANSTSWTMGEATRG